MTGSAGKCHALGWNEEEANQAMVQPGNTGYLKCVKEWARIYLIATIPYQGRSQ